MKHNIIKLFNAAMCVAAVAAMSCTNNFEEINTDPNKITVGEALPCHMLEPLIYNGATSRSNHTWRYNNELVQFTQHVGNTSNISRYYLVNSNFDGVWKLFANAARDAMHMYDLVANTDPGQYDVYRAVALTLKVMNLEEMTALFGDIPYSEAFQFRSTGLRQPKYDTQAEVYRNIFDDLETANSLYEAAGSTFARPELDGLYHGNVMAWRKFNNSLYLRALCRVSGREEMNVGQIMQKILDNPVKYPVFTSNDDNATVWFSGVKPYLTQFYNTTINSFTSSSYKMTENMVNLMVEHFDGDEGIADPRVRMMYMKNKNKTLNPEQIWTGVIAGATNADTNISNNKGPGMLQYWVLAKANNPICFMDYAEVEMILAEMAYKGIITGGEQAAKAHYNKALEASCRRWHALNSNVSDWGNDDNWPTPAAMSDTELNTFINESTIAAWDKSDDKLELIGKQKYILLFWNSYQPLCEIHRTGYPKLRIGNGTSFNNYTFPTRFAYPNDAIATNPDHAYEAIRRMGGSNDMLTPLWYSAQAIAADKK